MRRMRCSCWCHVYSALERRKKRLVLQRARESGGHAERSISAVSTESGIYLTMNSAAVEEVSIGIGTLFEESYSGVRRSARALD